MKFYTSVIPHRGRLLVRAIVNGKRIQKRISYKPSLFVPVKKETKYKTLDGRPCERIKFNSTCLLYTSPSPRDVEESRMPSSA